MQYEEWYIKKRIFIKFIMIYYVIRNGFLLIVFLIIYNFKNWILL